MASGFIAYWSGGMYYFSFTQKPKLIKALDDSSNVRSGYTIRPVPPWQT
jgi:hypothetical protein